MVDLRGREEQDLWCGMVARVMEAREDRAIKGRVWLVEKIYSQLVIGRAGRDGVKDRK